ncbi:FxsB family cyclophane-forming radical SAM/SPASM peptide maturase [Micromonospora andamanensis]|uniref:Radical SAM core domain-containing protein n=1 Tax=Micromonospora andamanensis TaxID=1287068 RepID=A0ABQ4I5R7_9ACTN|nr:FxsB family cyclophane-forming radical SAM/SPASM peptide maturase [Micromonospora andamanensis]GIJ13246.1 hypothetical protein Van01_64600 [Micromonospora andamanensis]GIJ38355.1 hypothetical protein Vwe01_16800 [Micromonospora andamanensis]
MSVDTADHGVGAAQRSLPFQEFILKLSSRCNLACDYCYIYELSDQTWRQQPTTMTSRTVDRTALRIGEHVQAHGLKQVDVVFHGGEPLLAGPALIDYAARAVRAAARGTVVNLSVQTNGLLLDERMVATLRRHRISVGVSLDGGTSANDRHRQYRDGRGSFAGVAANLVRLMGGPDRALFGGLLCTIDLANNPVQVYEDLLKFAPPSINFLLPHRNWTSPRIEKVAPTGHPYGDWLAAIFDRWYGAPRKETRVVLFEELMNLLLGGASNVEGIGLSPARMIVVSTDGSLEQVDSLKSTFDGAAATGYDVFRHPFDALLNHPDIVARQQGVVSLGEICQQCPLVSVCGGGYYPHRYREGSGFRNPSVYCLDLQRIITHVRDRLARDVHGLRENV